MFRIGGATRRHSCAKFDLRIGVEGELEEMESVPAFFSCTVNSAQFTFIRSRSAIHRSACSWGGIVSHLFSIFARVGLDIACAARRCTG